MLYLFLVALVFFNGRLTIYLPVQLVQNILHEQYWRFKASQKVNPIMNMGNQHFPFKINHDFTSINQTRSFDVFSVATSGSQKHPLRHTG